jgi:hypothetical protein
VLWDVCLFIQAPHDVSVIKDAASIDHRRYYFGTEKRYVEWVYFVLHFSRRTAHVTHHTSHITHHTSHITHHSSHITHHTSHITHHTSHITRHTLHITHHTSHITHYTSHIIRHTSRPQLRASPRASPSQVRMQSRPRCIRQVPRRQVHSVHVGTELRFRFVRCVLNRPLQRSYSGQSEPYHQFE